MQKAKTWKILHEASKAQERELDTEKIIKILLENRGLTSKKDIEAFLHPDITKVTPKAVGIDIQQLGKTVKRIQMGVKNKEKIIVYGDYDVDGITGTAILWETLRDTGADAMPYIPNRIDEGYGLSIAGIKNIQENIKNVSLIITVDNGIVANDAVDFANTAGIDVIITDHHTIGKALPEAFSIVHTALLCGAGIAWLLSKEFIKKENDHLSLVALATVADLVPLTDFNRVLLTYGLKELQNTKRPGLLALFQEAKVDPKKIDVYTIGHIIGPRLNAMGRLESAMDSLRLLCTKKYQRAKELADLLGTTNKERQLKTFESSEHAIAMVRGKRQQAIGKRLIFIAHDTYEEGIIGLVAGKLVEEFYLPAIVLSKGKKTSKASARSIHGFNIINFIRNASDLLTSVGGHPMAAGFTIETEKIEELQKVLEDLAEKTLHDDLLKRIMRIDMELPLEKVNDELYKKIQTLGPFGMGNMEPVFVSKVTVKAIKSVGPEGKHLQLLLAPPRVPFSFSAIAFGMGNLSKTLHIGDTITIAYTISENEWNNKKTIQLKVRDIQK